MMEAIPKLNLKTWTEGESKVITWDEPSGFSYKETLTPLPPTVMLQELETTDHAGRSWTVYAYVDPTDPSYLDPNLRNYLEEPWS